MSGRADLDGDERVAQRGLAEFADLHPRRAGGDQAHVLDDLVPAGELVVGADGESEELLGADDRRRPRGPARASPGAGRAGRQASRTAAATRRRRCMSQVLSGARPERARRAGGGNYSKLHRFLPLIVRLPPSHHPGSPPGARHRHGTSRQVPRPAPMEERKPGRSRRRRRGTAARPAGHAGGDRPRGPRPGRPDGGAPEGDRPGGDRGDRQGGRGRSACGKRR